jgi:hypothetical protein
MTDLSEQSSYLYGVAGFAYVCRFHRPQLVGLAFCDVNPFIDPLFAMFIGFQKYLVEGITVGSLKG